MLYIITLFNNVQKVDMKLHHTVYVTFYYKRMYFIMFVMLLQQTWLICLAETIGDALHIPVLW